MLASWSTYLLTFSLQLEMVRIPGGVPKMWKFWRGGEEYFDILGAHFEKSRDVGGHRTNPFYIHLTDETLNHEKDKP